MSKVLFETRVSVFVCQPTSHEYFVASSSGGHDDWINRYDPRLSQEPDLNNPALVLSVKAWQNAPPMGAIEVTSITLAIRTLDITLDFNNLFCISDIPSRDVAI